MNNCNKIIKTSLIFALLVVLIFVLQPFISLCENSNQKYLEYQYKKVDKLKTKLFKLKSIDSVYFNTLVAITISYEFLDIDSTEKYANLHLKLAFEHNSEFEKMRAYHSIGNVYQSKIDDYTAIKYYLIAFKIAKKLNADKHIIDLANTLAFSYQNLTQFDKAFEVLNYGYKVAKKSNNLDFLGGIMTNIGSLNVDLLKLDEALDNYLEALKCYQILKDKKFISATYLNIGLTYKKLDENMKALEYLKKSYQIENELMNDFKYNRSHFAGVNVYIVQLNIGEIYFEAKDYETSLKYFKSSFKGNLELKDYDMIINSSIYLTQVYNLKGNSEKVQDYLDTISKYQSKITNINILIDIKANYASYLYNKKEYKKAFQIVDSTLSTLNEFNMPMNSISLELINQGIISLEKINQPKLLIKYLKLKNKIVDSIYNVKLINKTTILKSKYEYNKKLASAVEENKIKMISEKKDLVLQSTIKWTFIIFTLFLGILGIYLYKNLKNTTLNNEILEKNKLELEQYNFEITENNLLINKQKEELFNINKTLDKYVNILSHDLRSPLSGIMLSVSNLIDYKDKFTKELILSKLEKINLSIQNSYNLLDDVLKFTTQINVKDYNPQPIVLYDIVEKNINLLNQNITNKEIKLKLNLDKQLIVNVDNKLIESVFRNLISNSIKYTPNNGKITISSEQTEDNTLIICLEDNGIGMTQTQIDNLFNLDKVKSTFGTIGEKGFGFGMILVKENIEKHNCKIWVESELNKGTKFYFTLPKS